MTINWLQIDLFTNYDKDQTIKECVGTKNKMKS